MLRKNDALRRENASLRDRVAALEADKAQLHKDLERERKERRTERDETHKPREDLLREAVERGQYAKLYHKLKSLPGKEWRTTFAQIEEILGRSLPKSARLYRPWWGNDSNGSHTYSNSWMVAGWETSQVNLTSETLLFVRK